MRLLIINGTLCDASLWHYLETGLAPCVYPDISDGKTVMEYARNIAANLEMPGWVLGYSLGGIIALELARYCPQKIRGLILVCSHCEGQTAAKEQAVASQLEMLNSEGLEAVIERILFPAYFGDLKVEGAVRRKAEEAVRRMAQALGPAVLKNQLQTLRTRRNQVSSLALIQIPVLLLCGAKDPLATADQNREMARLLPNNTLKIVADAGHLLPLSHPEFLLEAISEFMAS